MGKRIRSVKRTCVREARKLFHTVMGPGPEHAACLYWTLFICVVAREHGIRLIPQAGTAFWQRRPMADMSDVEDTHFGYEWDLHSDDVEKATRGLVGETGWNQVMPEMHCWAANPNTREIVDLTTMYLPKQAMACTGLTWEMPEPPLYVWGTQQKVEQALPGSLYQADRHATTLAMTWMNEALKDPAAQRLRDYRKKK